MTGESQTTNTNTLSVEQVKGRFVVMQIIHLALVTGVIAFGVIVLVLTRGKMSLDPAFHNPLFIVAGIMATMAILVSSVLPKLFFRSGAMPAEANIAVQKYQTFVLMRAAVIEGAALFSAVATILSYNILPVSLLVLCVAALVVHRPSQHEFIRLMKGVSTGAR